MRPLHLAGGRRWDGVGGSYAGDVWIDASGVIANGPLDGVRRLDVTGATIVPGLIESHAHLLAIGSRDDNAGIGTPDPQRGLLAMAGAAQRALRAGITTVRDLGAPTPLAVTVRAALAAGDLIGPRLLVAGAPITPSRGHCWWMGGEADGASAIRQRVDQLAADGVDWIKVMVTGGHLTPGTDPLVPQFTQGDLNVLVSAAHARGLPVAAHCHGTEGIRMAVDAGADSLEHCAFAGPDRSIDRDDALIARIAARRIVVSPTVPTAFERLYAPEALAARGQLLRDMLDAGCHVVMSTDCGIPGVAHDDLPAALALFAAMTHLSAAEALPLVTSAAADGLRLAERGRLATGLLGDVLVVDGDPSVDLRQLLAVRHVILGGVIVA